MTFNNEAVRRSTLATLDEIDAAERRMGGHLREDDEWQQLKDIVARIERKIKPQNHAELEDHIERGFSPGTV